VIIIYKTHFDIGYSERVQQVTLKICGMNISSVILRKFNKPLSVSAKTTDVPGQSWLIPTLFTHAGIKFYYRSGSGLFQTTGIGIKHTITVTGCVSACSVQKRRKYKPMIEGESF
jgi:hypothetical protein